MAISRPRPRVALLPITDISARMPPSPWLSARMTITQYLMETLTISAQTTRESRPRASGAAGWPPTVSTMAW